MFRSAQHDSAIYEMSSSKKLLGRLRS